MIFPAVHAGAIAASVPSVTMMLYTGIEEIHNNSGVGQVVQYVGAGFGVRLTGKAGGVDER